MRDASAFLAAFWAQERALVASGLEPMPEWWRREIERFYRSGKRRWVIRKGRRVFASTCVAPRLAVAEMLFGEHPHLSGTPPLLYAFLSVQRGESVWRLTGITAILNALNVAHETAAATVRVKDYPAVFQVITASFRATVGGTVAFAWCDEVSSWNDDKVSKNPAEQVIGTLAPALATLPDARLFLVSSPLTSEDYHAKQFELGETPEQCVSFGTTWDITRGSVRELTEEQTRAMEPNLRWWNRAYAAVPVDGVEEDWFGDAACAVTFTDETPPAVRLGMAPIFTIDPAFANDYFGWSVVTSEPASGVANDNDRRLTVVQDSGAWKPDGEPRALLERLRDQVLRPYAHLAGNDNATFYVHTDQAEFYSLREVARQLGITLLLESWTGGASEKSKLTRFRAVRTAMLGGEVRINRSRRGGELHRQFRSVAGVLLPSGNERIEYKRSGEGHCDELSAVAMGLALALERPPVAARPVVVVQKKDNPVEWRKAAIKEMEEKRRREWKRSPQDVLRKAMGGR